MAESDFQRKPLTYAVEALSTYFQNRPNVYVSGNLFIYYEEGNPQANVAPDVFVVFGVEKRDRPSYFLWQEGKAPDFVLEITSKSTVSVDQGSKRGLYAYLGVQEYFQYDPVGDYLRPALKGLRLTGENYLPITETIKPDGTLILTSQVLGLELRLTNEGLRFYNPESGKKLLNLQESEKALQEAEARIAELEAALNELNKK
ncbi:MAG: Uma2 family endonuclease [Candidatus Promineifilaceae bacterium]